MATNAALMLAFTIVTLLLPLIVGKQMALRIIRRRRGEDGEDRRQEVARLLIVTTTATVMCAAVLFMAPQTIASDIMPGAAATAMPRALAELASAQGAGLVVASR